MSRRHLVAAAACALALTTGAGAAQGAPLASPVPASSVSMDSAVSTTLSSARPSVSAAARPQVLRPGMTGAQVVSLQKRLAALGYWVGTTSGRYDHSTGQAVMALQKVAGLSRDGSAGPATFRALDRQVRPKARSTRGRVVEIDLQRQVLLLVTDGRVRQVFNTSTGAAATPTPAGSYRVFRQVDRWHTAPLGKLYRPKFFHRGYAVHGVTDGNIPGHPASHGCARVSTAAMDLLWGDGGLRVGDRVLVY